MKNRFIILFISISCIFLTNCIKPKIKTVAKSNIKAKDSVIVHPLHFETEALNDSLINNFVDSNSQYSPYAAGLKEFYKKRNYEYAWFTKDGINSRTGVFFNMINRPSISNDSIVILYNEIVHDTSIARAKTNLIKLELSLTSSFFTFADKEWAGNNEKLVKQLQWYIPKKRLKYDDILDTLLKKEDTVIFEEPVYRQYGLLKKYLAKYNHIEENGGWNVISMEEKGYKPGDSATVIASIKKRLFITGDLVNEDSSIIFNETLETAVKTFQRRYGMTENGKIDKTLIAEMNVPVHKRIEQIIINMERCRWVPQRMDGNYLIVNIPEFRLHVYDGDKYLWNMNVVVGKATNRTIIFSGNLKYVVFNPYWSVPPSIFTKEILPDLRKNPAALNRQNMELFKMSDPEIPIDPTTINWNNKDSFYHGYGVRQKPGINNALGKVKFLFPNEYNIYLHDTPSKSLFSRASRSFSHGCIRLAEPEKMAQFLLRNDPGWSANAIKKAMETGKEQYVVHKKGVPVFIAYFTSWVDREGHLNFRNDIYGHDARMIKLLIEKPAH